MKYNFRVEIYEIRPPLPLNYSWGATAFVKNIDNSKDNEIRVGEWHGRTFQEAAEKASKSAIDCIEELTQSSKY